MSPHPNQPRYKLSTFDSFFRWLHEQTGRGEGQRVRCEMLLAGKKVALDFTPAFIALRYLAFHG